MRSMPAGLAPSAVDRRCGPLVYLVTLNEGRLHALFLQSVSEIAEEIPKLLMTGCHHRLRTYGCCSCSILRRCVSRFTYRCCVMAFKSALTEDLRSGYCVCSYSHSMVAGGLEVRSYTTRFTPRTSLTMRLETRASRSCGSGAQSAVMKSWLLTARSTMVSW